MSVSLEPVDVPESEPTPTQIEAPGSNQTEAPEGNPSFSVNTKESVAVQQITDEAPEEPPVATESKPILPEPKKRGRPRKEVQEPKTPKAAPKAAPKKAVRMKPPSPVHESSSEEETPLTRDDMETLLLDYLVKRKQSQQQARRTMWSQLAGLS